MESGYDTAIEDRVIGTQSIFGGPHLSSVDVIYSPQRYRAVPAIRALLIENAGKMLRDHNLQAVVKTQLIPCERVVLDSTMMFLRNKPALHNHASDVMVMHFLIADSEALRRHPVVGAPKEAARKRIRDAWRKLPRQVRSEGDYAAAMLVQSTEEALSVIYRLEMSR